MSQLPLQLEPDDPKSALRGADYQGVSPSTDFRPARLPTKDRRARDARFGTVAGDQPVVEDQVSFRESPRRLQRDNS